MSKPERYELGEFSSAEAAVRACREVVDDFLDAHHEEGMSAEELFEQYTTFGEDPFIVSDDRDVAFSGWTYARKRCGEVCGDGG